MTIDRDICSRAPFVFPGGRCGIISSLMWYPRPPIGSRPRSGVRLLTLVLALSGAGGAPALATEPYGRRVIAAQATWIDEAAPRVAPDHPRVAPGERPAARERAQNLRRRLREQELAQGPYAAPLAETLADLARALDALGDDPAALKARERALHLTRVNEGLYSAAQAPLLRALLAGHRRRGEFARLDQRYDYFFRLYGAGRPPRTEARWAATLEYLRWQREALRRRIDGADFRRRLLELHALHEDLLKALRPDGQAVDWERERDLAFSQLKTLYLIEAMVAPPVEDFGALHGDRARREGSAEFDRYRERLDNLKRGLRGRGRKLMTSLLAVVPPRAARARAEIQLALADWLQWQGATREAEEAYLALWNRLEGSPYEPLARAWFARPVPLPDNGVFWQSDRRVDAAVALRVSVAANGRARIDFAAVPAAERRTAGRVRRSLHNLRFRPRIENGALAPTELPAARWLLLASTEFEP